MTTMPRSDVHDFFDRYREAFAAFDAVAIGDLFAFPCLVASGGDGTHVTTAATIEEWLPQMERLVAAYRAIGVRSADVLALRTAELSPGLVHAWVHWGLRGEGGASLYEFDAAYTLADLGEGLRITAIAHNEAPRLRMRMREMRAG
jgi:hypothetical protein